MELTERAVMHMCLGNDIQFRHIQLLEDKENILDSFELQLQTSNNLTNI